MAIQGDIKLNISPLEITLRDFQNAIAPAGIEKAARIAGQAVGVQGEGIMRQYPPSPNGRPRREKYTRQRIKDGNPTGEVYLSKWASKRQQGYFFGTLLHSGQVPYKRTGTLGRSIRHDVQILGDGTLVRVVFGSSAPYAKWVIGDDQAEYHAATGWKVIGQQIDLHRKELEDTFVNTFRTALFQQIR